MTATTSPPRFDADHWRAWGVAYVRRAEARMRAGKERAAISTRRCAQYCFDKANEAVLNPDLRAAP